METQRTSFQIGWLAGYLGKPAPDGLNTKEYAAGYARGARDAARDRR